MVQEGAVTMFHVRGVPIRAHWTLLLILPYLAIVLSSDFRALPDLAGVVHARLTLPPLMWGALLALALFASITVHELAHVFAASRFGGRVRGITLMLVGGMSQISHLPQIPKQEAIVAAAGPLASFGLGAFLLGTRAFWSGAPADVEVALFYLGTINLMLGAFNLIPAFPMDGGRIVRAALAARLGSKRATVLAAGLGKACGIGLAIGGVWSSNIMLLLVALFVYSGARSELAEETTRTALAELHAIDLLPHDREAPTIAEDQRLDAIITRMHALDRLDLIVLDAWHVPIGVIDVHELASIDPDERWSLTAGRLARRHHAKSVSVASDLSANDALDVASEAGAEHVIVIDPKAPPAEAVLGLIASADLVRTASLQMLAAEAHPVHEVRS